jgi:uncharacterized protein (TIGR03437 family)
MQVLSVRHRAFIPARLLYVAALLALGWLAGWPVFQGRTPASMGGLVHGRSLSSAPALSYSTYLGGARLDEAEAVTTDRDGNVYVVGLTSSSNFPVKNAVQPTRGGEDDAYVVKLSPTGEIIYSTYLGGDDDDEAVGIAVDSAGAAYIVGTTLSADFPTKNAAQSQCSGAFGVFGVCVGDAFVTKLSADGGAILYSTYLGGSLPDDGSAIAVDDTGAAYVLGETFSSNFPIKGALQTSRRGEADLFIAKLDTTRSGADSYVFGTYFGGGALENAEHIVVNGAGDIYIVGDTLSSDFPTEKAAQSSHKGFGDAFVTRLSANGASLVYSTYLGGGNKDYGYGIAVDSSGAAYVTGDTQSSDFTTKNALIGAFGGGVSDAFAAKFGPDGTLVYSTYLGSGGTDYGRSVAVDGEGQAYLAGNTNSGGFMTKNPIQPYRGEEDLYLIKLSAAGDAVLFGTFFGGSKADLNSDLAMDRAGNLAITGLTTSTDFPTLKAAQASFGGGFFDAFVTKLAMGGASPERVTNVHAASYDGSTLAADAIVSAFGSNLATATLAASSLPLPTTLGGTQVSVRDSGGVTRLAPLFFVSPTQVNYLMPQGLALGPATVTIQSGDGATSAGAVRLEQTAPGLFSADASGKGAAAAIALRIKADGTQQYEAVAAFDAAQNKYVLIPIDLGAETDQVFLLLFGGGIRHRASLSAVRFKIGGLDTEAVYAGEQSGFAGLDQVNARLSRSLIGRGEVDVTVTVDGKTSNIVRVSIR